MNQAFSTLLLVFLLSGCFSGCSSEDITTADSDLPEHLQGIENLTVYPADAEPTHDIRFFEEFVFDTAYTSNNGNINVDDQDHLIVGRRNMQVYDPDGNLVAEMGGRGQGPGEFAGFSQGNPQIFGNRLFGIDNINARINHFSLETYSSSGAFLLDPAAWQNLEGMQSTNIDPSNYFAVNDSTLLMGFTKRLSPDSESSEASENSFFLVSRDIKYYLMNMEGQIISDLITTQNETFSCPTGGVFGICAQLGQALLFFKHALMEVNSDNQIIKANTDEIFIEFFNSEGVYLRSFYHPIQPVALDVNQLDVSQETKEVFLERENFPEHWPAFKTMLIDDENRIWLSVIIEDDNTLRWWVLDSDGTLLATFDWPGKRQINVGFRNIGIKSVKNGYIYASELTNEEFGTGKLSRYRFELTER